MAYRNFEELFQSMKKGLGKRAAVVWANEEHTLEAVRMAVEDGIIKPVLIGEAEKLKQRLSNMKYPEIPEIMQAETPEEAVMIAVEMAAQGKVDLIIKGLVETEVIMRQIVKKKNGLYSRGVLSHLTLVELPTYHKLLGVTDCALLTYPDIQQKKEEIRNALEFYHRIGYNMVKIAALAAVEKINQKMPETLEAAELKKAGEQGEFPGSIIEGPISYDLSVVEEAVKIKNYHSPVAGDADLLVAPNITVGNILIKALSYSAKGFTAAIVLGAKVPVVITSRSSPIKSKITAIKLAAAMERK